MSGVLARFFRPLVIAVIALQGIHVFEHIAQLVQVYVLGIEDEKALGLLGYVFQIQGTEEWLHLVFNNAWLLALLLIVSPLRRSVPALVPRGAFALFLFGIALEGWHDVEHAVIISNVIAHNGCPCPGIVDAATGLTDKVVHFFYNVVAYVATVPALWSYVRRTWRRGDRRVSFAHA
jgi:hypothetical protein